jgi:hypothetical protein
MYNSVVLLFNFKNKAPIYISFHMLFSILELGIYIPGNRCNGRVLPSCIWYVEFIKIKDKIHSLLAKSGPFKLF